MNYRKIWEQAYGPIPKDGDGRTYDIHHIDGNRKNNSIDNLICLTIEDHYKIHLKQFEENKSEKEFRSLLFLAKRINKDVDTLTGWTVSQETREKIRRTLAETRAKQKALQEG
jgi:methionyl-tRNA synthetase